jgi:hypothetical protein
MYKRQESAHATGGKITAGLRLDWGSVDQKVKVKTGLERERERESETAERDMLGGIC